MSRPELRTLVFGLTLALLSGCGSSNDAATEAMNSSAEAEVVTSERVESSSFQPESTPTTIPEDDIENLTESVHAEEETDDPLPSSTESSEDDGTDSSPTVTQTTVATSESSSTDLEEDYEPEGDVYDPLDFFYDLRIAPELPRDGYERDGWPHWSPMSDVTSWNTSSCDVRQYMVNFVEAQKLEGRFDTCSPISGGAWRSDYDGVWTLNPSSFDLDHIVSLSEAHDSGGANWTRDQKEAFANDFVNLILVSASSNRSKGDRDVVDWRPPEHLWCSFAGNVVWVKYKYDLAVDQAEYESLNEMLNTCETLSTMNIRSGLWVGNMFPLEVPTDAQTTTSISPDTTVSSSTTADIPENPGDTKNCSDFETYSEAKTWFDYHYPHYGDVAQLDGDNDGEPCESLPGGP